MTQAEAATLSAGGQVCDILYSLPIPLQQHVVYLAPSDVKHQLRLCSQYLRHLSNANVRHAEINAHPSGRTAELLATVPLEERFPTAKSLRIHTTHQTDTSDDDICQVLHSCTSFLARCTSLTVSRAIDYTPPSHDLISTLASTITSHLATLQHLRLDLQIEDNPMQPPSTLPLSHLVPPDLTFPVLKSLHLDAMFAEIPPALQIHNLPALTALTLSKIPITMSHPDGAAQLISALPNLAQLHLGFFRQFDSGYVSPDMQPITRLSTLTALHLDGDGCMLSPATTGPLTELPTLHSLTFATWRIMATDALHQLAMCRRLQQLSFTSCFFEQLVTIEAIENLTQLTSFELDHPILHEQQDIGLRCLSKLTNLQQLAVDYPPGTVLPTWMLQLLH